MRLDADAPVIPTGLAFSVQSDVTVLAVDAKSPGFGDFVAASQLYASPMSLHVHCGLDQLLLLFRAKVGLMWVASQPAQGTCLTAHRSHCTCTHLTQPAGRKVFVTFGLSGFYAEKPPLVQRLFPRHFSTAASAHSAEFLSP